MIEFSICWTASSGSGFFTVTKGAGRGEKEAARSIPGIVPNFSAIAQTYNECLTFTVNGHRDQVIIDGRVPAKVLFPQEFLCLIELSKRFEFIGWFSTISASPRYCGRRVGTKRSSASSKATRTLGIADEHKPSPANALAKQGGSGTMSQKPHRSSCKFPEDSLFAACHIDYIGDHGTSSGRGGLG